MAVAFPPCADSVGGDVKVSAGQRAVNDIPTTLLRGMESRSAVHAAVHDRITATNYDVHTFGKARLLPTLALFSCVHSTPLSIVESEEFGVA